MTPRKSSLLAITSLLLSLESKKKYFEEEKWSHQQFQGSFDYSALMVDCSPRPKGSPNPKTNSPTQNPSRKLRKMFSSPPKKTTLRISDWTLQWFRVNFHLVFCRGVAYRSSKWRQAFEGEIGSLGNFFWVWWTIKLQSFFVQFN